MCSSLTGKVFSNQVLYNLHGFCLWTRSQELCDTFLRAAYWHLCLLAVYRCTDRGNMGQSQGKEASALLKPELNLCVPHACWGTAECLEHVGRAMPFAVGISHCQRDSLVCKDSHRTGTQQELVIDDIWHCSTSTSLFISTVSRFSDFGEPYPHF